MFRSDIHSLLGNLSDRLRSADNLKVGLFGQQIEMSGTVKQLINEREKLLVEQSDSQAKVKAAKINQSLSQLNTPMADIVGLSLLKSTDEGLELCEIVRKLFSTVGMNEDPKAMPPYAILETAKTVERILVELQSLKFVQKKGERYRLTDDGKEFFKHVSTEQNLFLQKFAE